MGTLDWATQPGSTDSELAPSQTDGSEEASATVEGMTPHNGSDEAYTAPEAMEHAASVARQQTRIKALMNDTSSRNKA